MDLRATDTTPPRPTRIGGSILVFGQDWSRPILAGSILAEMQRPGLVGQDWLTKFNQSWQVPGLVPILVATRIGTHAYLCHINT